MTEQTVQAGKDTSSVAAFADQRLARKLLPALLTAGVLLPISVGLNYLLYVILAQALPVRHYGIFTFTVSLTGVLALALSFGFSQSMMRLVPAYRVRGETRLLSGLLKGSLRLISLVTLAAAVCMVVASSLAQGGGLSTAIAWSALALPLWAVDLWRENTMRGMHRMADAILPRQLLLPLAVIAAVLVLAPRDIFVVMAIFLTIFALAEAYGLFRLHHTLKPAALPAPAYAMSHWLSISTPMGLGALAHHGIRNWDIVMVGVLAGIADAGVYAAAARTALLASLVLRAVNLVVGPVFSELYHSRDHRLGRLFDMSLLGTAALGVPLYVAVLIFAPQILGIFGEGYERGAGLLRILATGEFINLVTGPAGLLLTMTRHERVNMVIVVAAAVLNLAALIIVLPVFGITGAAVVTATAIVSLNVLQFLHACRFLHRLSKAG